MWKINFLKFEATPVDIGGLTAVYLLLIFSLFTYFLYIYIYIYKYSFIPPQKFIHHLKSGV